MIDDDVRSLLFRGGPRHRCRTLRFEEGHARVVIRYPTMGAVARRAWLREKRPRVPTASRP